MKRNWPLLLLITGLLLLGCSDTTTPDLGPTDASASPLSTPIEATSAAAVPTAIEPTVPATPFTEDTGAVSGFLLRGDPPEAVQPGLLYLGEVIADSEGTAIMASVDKQLAPKAATGPSGRFMFTHVPPGQYAIVLDLISSSVILRDPTTSEDLLIDVEAGQITDLGRLIYADLPALP